MGQTKSARISGDFSLSAPCCILKTCIIEGEGAETDRNKMICWFKGFSDSRKWNKKVCITVKHVLHKRSYTLSRWHSISEVLAKWLSSWIYCSNWISSVSKVKTLGSYSTNSTLKTQYYTVFFVIQSHECRRLLFTHQNILNLFCSFLNILHNTHNIAPPPPLLYSIMFHVVKKNVLYIWKMFFFNHGPPFHKYKSQFEQPI